MKNVFIAAVLAASVALGQYLEKTIWLPDSFRAVGTPSNVLYNSGSNTIYVGDRSSGGIVVLDGITLRKAAQVFLPGAPSVMLYAPEVNKVYCLTRSDSVYVIDGAGHGVLTRVPVGQYPKDLCYNSVSRRIYCASYSGQSVTAIDANADTVVATVTLPVRPEKMCCNWVGNKVYSAERSEGRVYVIDGAGDSILTDLYVSEVPGQMLYNPLSNRVYCPDEAFDDVGIIDAGADTLIRWITMGASHMGLCMNPPDNELYVTDGSLDRLFVICGTGDSLKSRTDIGAGPRSPVYDSATKRVYVVCQDSDSLVAIDAAGDTVVDRVKVGDSPAGLCIDTRQRRAFVAHWGSRDVQVVDVPVDTVIADIDFWFGPTALAYCSEQDKVYCTGTSERSALVIDASSNRVITDLHLGPHAGTLLCPAGVSKVYCGRSRYEGTALWAIDPVEDTVLAEIPVGLGPHALAFRPGGPGNAKVYCANDGSESVTVIDAATDSAVATVDVGGNNPFAVVYGQDLDAVFVQCEYPVWLSKIDCSVDTVVSEHVISGDAYAPLVYVEGRRLVCVAASEDLWVLDAVDLSQVRVYRLGDEATSLAYCRREHKVYYACWSGSLYAINMTSGQVVSVPAALYEKELLYDSLSNRLYCISESEGTAQVLDCATDSVLCVLQLGEGPVAAAWSPFWRRVYVANGDGSSISVIRDSSVVGIGEGVQQTRGARVTQTVVRGVLNLAEDGTRSEFGANSVMSLVDITGRKVMDLKPGENEVRHLAPGVYFVTPSLPPSPPEGERRKERGLRSAVRKVIINP
ncbi:MAG: hypothetical protein JSU73_10170 [candidate division WOR-3 bacterium]|nr:MAG: hypothetical protein JSU73_10170 [candidate division WOR-3 bacterium]